MREAVANARMPTDFEYRLEQFRLVNAIKGKSDLSPVNNSNLAIYEFKSKGDKDNG